MFISLLVTTFVMGLTGGPHCLLMCGTGCLGMRQMCGQQGSKAILGFHLGRLIGYSFFGVLVAFSFQQVQWLSQHSAVLKPIWIFLHVGALLTGLFLMFTGQQTLMLVTLSQSLWKNVVRRPFIKRMQVSSLGPFCVGLFWVLLPCGLLYSALSVAALSAHPFQGGMIMGSFALGSASVLWMGPQAWRLISNGVEIGSRHSFFNKFFHLSLWSKVKKSNVGMKCAGLTLVVVSTLALWEDMVQTQGFWCQLPLS